MTDRSAALATIRVLIDGAHEASRRDGWGRATLAAAAREAGVSLSDARRIAPDVVGLFAALAGEADAAAAEALDAGAEPAATERLFDAAMARFDALAPSREAIASFYATARRDPFAVARLAPVRLRTIVSLLEICEVPTRGPEGARRIVALARLWAPVFEIWLRDDDDQSRTMAALDKGLRERARLWPEPRIVAQGASAPAGA